MLNRSPKVVISNTSGVSGIAHWLNAHYQLPNGKPFDKQHPLAVKLKSWVDEQYANGRVTTITDGELEEIAVTLAAADNLYI